MCVGLYYYGARYLDPKYSRWISADPALGEYLPQAPINDEAKKHNRSLQGQGGVFNVINLNLYHYAGNNPIKYTDPDGKVAVAAVAAVAVLGTALLISYETNQPLKDSLRQVCADIHESIQLAADEAKMQRQAKLDVQKNSNVDKSGNNSSNNNQEGYKPAPKELPGIPDAKPVKPKTPKQGGGSGLRKRWKDDAGNIYEWDYQHGDVEKYDKRGKHLGSVDPNTGEQTKPPVPGREVEP